MGVTSINLKMRTIAAFACVAALAVRARGAPAEASARADAIRAHEAAQAADPGHCEAPGCSPQLIAAYERAVAAYDAYLTSFASLVGAIQLRFSRAQILYFKLGRYEQAGDDYAIVGKSAGPLQRVALLAAMDAFDRARGKTPNTIDAKLTAVAEAYLAAFAGGPDADAAMFHVAKLALDRGKVGKAVDLFRAIVTRYPRSRNAGPAGDAWLAALDEKRDFAALAATARTLRAAPAFAAKDRQERLTGLIVQASERQAALEAQPARAAEWYLAAAAELTGDRATKDEMNAAQLFAKANALDRALDTYVALAARFPSDPTAAKALSSAAATADQLAQFSRAAELAEQLADMYPRDPSAPDALFNAMMWRRATGARDRAISDGERYVHLGTGRRDTADVMIEIARWHAEAGDHAKAEAELAAVAHQFSSSRQASVAAIAAAREAIEQSKLDAASKYLAAVTAPPLRGEARLVQGEIAARKAADLHLAGPMPRLGATLAAKIAAMRAAQAIFAEVAKGSDPALVVAALVRNAAVAEGLAKEIAAFRVAPSDLGGGDPSVAAAVANLVTEATTLDKAAYAKALELGVYSEDTFAARAALVRLGAAAADREARTSDDALPPDPPVIERH